MNSVVWHENQWSRFTCSINSVVWHDESAGHIVCMICMYEKTREVFSVSTWAPGLLGSSINSQFSPTLATYTCRKLYVFV